MTLLSPTQPAINLADIALPASDQLTETAALQLYETLSPVMPRAERRQPSDIRPSDIQPPNFRRLEALIEMLDEVDGLVLDGFGVINTGAEMIPAIVPFLEAAERRHLPILVLTNGASVPSSRRVGKFQNWGLPIEEKQILSSRDALIHHLSQISVSGLTVTLDMEVEKLGLAGEEKPRNPADIRDMVAEASQILICGTIGWTEETQDAFEKGLLAAKSKGGLPQLYVANPDVISPQPTGSKPEPGYWVARAMKQTGIQPGWFGKPHQTSYHLALDRMAELASTPIPADRLLMVGDTPHTDILGGQAAGMKTALLTGYGLMRALDVDYWLSKTGIYPDYLAKKLV